MENLSICFKYSTNYIILSNHVPENIPFKEFYKLILLVKQNEQNQF